MQEQLAVPLDQPSDPQALGNIGSNADDLLHGDVHSFSLIFAKASDRLI